jgi:hypothetical protein
MVFGGGNMSEPSVYIVERDVVNRKAMLRALPPDLRAQVPTGSKSLAGFSGPFRGDRVSCRGVRVRLRRWRGN